LITYNDGTSNYSFDYDGNGNRLTKTIDNDIVNYVNDITKTNEEVLSYTLDNITTNYTYGATLLYENNNSYSYDSFGNVVKHASERYSYAPYGTLTDGVIDNVNEYGYKGEVHDSASLQYLRARYYNTTLSQFISEDTYTGNDNNPLSQNRYTFVSNNPYKYSDPSGNFIASIAGDKKYIANATSSKKPNKTTTKTSNSSSTSSPTTMFGSPGSNTNPPSSGGKIGGAIGAVGTVASIKEALSSITINPEPDKSNILNPDQCSDDLEIKNAIQSTENKSKMNLIVNDYFKIPSKYNANNSYIEDEVNSDDKKLITWEFLKNSSGYKFGNNSEFYSSKDDDEKDHGLDLVSIYTSTSVLHGEANYKSEIGNLIIEGNSQLDFLNSNASIKFSFNDKSAGVAAETKASVISASAGVESDVYGIPIKVGIELDALSIGYKARLGYFENEGYVFDFSGGFVLFGVGGYVVVDIERPDKVTLEDLIYRISSENPGNEKAWSSYEKLFSSANDSNENYNIYEEIDDYYKNIGYYN